ncbi:hypothetical protein HMSSN036_71940 [Paenibacillus macerans]|nr:hypothetical protein HMSSN036_71940 [Paenibacillus macerans]
MGLSYVLNRIDGENVPLGESYARAYERYYKAPGLFLSWEDRHGVEILNDSLPVSTIQGISTVQDGLRILGEAKAGLGRRIPAVRLPRPARLEYDAVGRRPDERSAGAGI